MNRKLPKAMYFSEMKKIFKHGVRYAEQTLSIWYKRKGKLITAWCIADENKLQVENFLYKEKCDRLIDELEQRISSLLGVYGKYKELKKKQDEELKHSFIHIQCHNSDCKYSMDATITAVMFKDYEVGKHRCEKCGDELKSDEEIAIEDELRRLGLF